MESFRKIWLLALSFWLLVPLSAAVYTPQDVPDPKVNGQEYYVSDPDGILADSTVNWLNQCAAMLNEKTHVEMAIVALQSIGETDAFDFSYELFQRWGIGREGQNTGVLILFVLDSHDLQIRTGTGIEGVLTDAKCSRIMYDEMFPAFKAGDYDAGLCLGALSIYETCTDGAAPEELLTIQSVTDRGRYAPKDDEWTMEDFIILFCLGLGVIYVIRAFRRAIFIPCPNCKKRKLRIVKYKTLVAATYATEGKREVKYRCKHCGYEFLRIETIPVLTESSSSSGGGSSWSGGGSSDSGGSWGGGSTSGGGAGGKW